MKFCTYYLLLHCFLMSCSSNNQYAKIEHALFLAGENKVSLENVLEYFKHDTLKYKAAYFLIENMPYHQSLEEYYLSPKGEKYRPDIRNFANKDDLQKHCDSLIKAEYIVVQNILNDIETIDGDFLINNIELAFDVWEKPWAKNVSFEDFCKYILPYNSQIEKRSSLRRKMMEKFLPILDSAKVKTSIEACRVLNQHLRNVVKYKETGLPFYPTIEEVYESGISQCDGICNLGVFIMRAVGIPVTVDFTIWSKMDLGHSWCVVLDNGRFQSFGPGEEQPEVHARMLSLLPYRRPAKVYRLQYSSEQITENSTNEYHTFLNNPLLYDVTHEYIDATTSFQVPVLDNAIGINNDVYLCIYNYYEWKPLALGTYTKNGFCNFENIVGDNVFIVASTVNSKLLRYITAPFYVNKEGKITLLIPNCDKKHPITLKKGINGEHYTLQYWDIYRNSFISIPHKKSTDTTQVYEGIPDNALFRFTTPKRIVNQRIFFIENDTIKHY